VAPLFEALGQRTIWVGAVGAGSRLKLVNNIWLAFTAEAIATSVALARRLGLETETVVNALGGSSLVSPWQEAKLSLADEWQQAVDDGLGDQDLTVVTCALEQQGGTPRRERAADR
jgi:3-hydroxyisobutyrate dehydrogenase